MKNLQISRTIIDHLIELNNAVRELDNSEEGFNSLPSGEEVLKYVTDPRRLEMHKIINTLPQEEKDELSAIMWVGRGDFAGFDDAMAHASGFHGENAGSYLGAKPLGKYLPEGLEILEAEGIIVR